MYFPNPSYKANSADSSAESPQHYNMVSVRIEPPRSPYEPGMRELQGRILGSRLVRRIDRRTNEYGEVYEVILTLPEDGLKPIDSFLLTRIVGWALQELSETWPKDC